jgi:hypothetical protein
MREKSTVAVPMGLKMEENMSALWYSFRNKTSGIISLVQPQDLKQL